MINRPSNLKIFFYYLSFVLVFATLAFIASMLLMDYEDLYGTLNWTSQMKVHHKVGYILFYILQFPLGLLFGLFTGNYDNGLFSFLINPLLIAWALHKAYKRCEYNLIKRAQIFNYSLWTSIILFIIVYIITE